MDYNLITKRFLDKWREHLKRHATYKNQVTMECILKNAPACPYNKLQTRGTTYPRVGGGYAMGLTLVDLAKELGFKSHIDLAGQIFSRGMPKATIEVNIGTRVVKLYDPDTAKKISEYIQYSYKKPSKLIKSYEEYFT